MDINRTVPPRPDSLSASCLKAALWALEAGLWPVVIHPYNAKGPSPGKRPIGQAWGLERPTEQYLRSTFSRHPGANVGLKLGSEGHVVDIDVDDPEVAEAVLARLFPDGTPETWGWTNDGGRFHLLFEYDDRLARLGKSIVKGGEFYPGLEIRIGSAPGEKKQLQTVVPPSLLANGAARKWLPSRELLPFPESLILDLEAHALQKPSPTRRVSAQARSRDPQQNSRWTPENRAAAYLEKCEPAVSGQDGHGQTLKTCVKVGPGFDLHPDTAFGLLWNLFNPTCDPPWSESELRRKVDEAYKVESRRGWLLEENRNGYHHVGNGKPPVEPPLPPVETDPAPRERPEIEVNTERHVVVAKSLLAINADPSLYRRGPSLVSVVLDRDDEMRLTSRTTMKGLAGSPRIISLSDAVVGCHLTKNCRFYQWRTPPKGEARAVDAHPPDWLIKAVATHQHYPGMRPLLAVAECPFPRPDGSIVESPGYDAETGTLYMPSIEFRPLPSKPTRDDARAAWSRIARYLREFPFASDDDRVVTLAGMLTVIARPAIPGPVPGIVVNGNKAGTGKGLLIDVMSIPGTGRSAPTSNYPGEKEEAVKVKVAIALGGDPVVHFDNLEEGTEYGNGALDGAMTSSETNDRVLGQNDRPKLPLRPAWFITGNNLSPGSDAHRRWLVCNLVTELESPEQRTDIEVRNLRAVMIAERAAIVADALTILKAHALAGRPGDGWGPMGSFEDWDLVVRGAVWFATERDCLTTQRRTAAESPSRLAKIALLEGWRELPGGRAGSSGVTVAEALKLVEGSSQNVVDPYPTLRGALIQKGRGGKLPSASALGNLLRGMKNSSIGGYRLRENGDSHRAVLWVVEGESGESGESKSRPPTRDFF